MKTIFVIYSYDTDKSLEDLKSKKRYVFRTNDDLQVGDIVKSDNYDANMVVVEVLNKDFLYFNKSTGELSNELGSTQQYPIRTLQIVDKSSADVILAVKIGNLNG